MAKITKSQRGALRTILDQMEKAQAMIDLPTTNVMHRDDKKGTHLDVKHTSDELAKLRHSITDLGRFLAYN